MRVLSVNSCYLKNKKTNSNNQKSVNVTFGYSLPFKNMHLRCFKCGEYMVAGKIVRKFSKQDFTKDAQDALNKISSYKKFMQKTEKKCLETLIEENKKFNENNLQALLIRIRPTYMEQLKKEQYQILDKIDEFCDVLPVPENVRLEKINMEAREIMSCEKREKGPFKRKIWLENIYELTEKMQDRELADKIYQTAVSFPTAHDNVSAFIIKYSRQDSQKIGVRFLSEAEVSIDHFEAYDLGGESDWKNYVPKHRSCNSHEGNKTPYRRVKDDPQSIKNAQKAMDRIIGLINAGRKRLEEFYDYPQIIAKKFVDTTQNPNNSGDSFVKLDISKLKNKEDIEKNKQKTAAWIAKQREKTA